MTVYAEQLSDNLDYSGYILTNLSRKAALDKFLNLFELINVKMFIYPVENNSYTRLKGTKFICGDKTYSVDDFGEIKNNGKTCGWYFFWAIN